MQEDRPKMRDPELRDPEPDRPDFILEEKFTGQSKSRAREREAGGGAPFPTIPLHEQVLPPLGPLPRKSNRTDGLNGPGDRDAPQTRQTQPEMPLYFRNIARLNANLEYIGEQLQALRDRMRLVLDNEMKVNEIPLREIPKDEEPIRSPAFKAVDMVIGGTVNDTNNIIRTISEIAQRLTYQ